MATTAGAVDVGELEGRLLEAARVRAPIAPLTEAHAGLTAADAYAVQVELIGRKKAAGARVVGDKVGLTSRAIQQMLGVDQPDYGHLLDSMRVADGAVAPMARLIQPRAEPEVAFVMARDLHGPVTPEAVVEATELVMPAIEIIDSRIANWKIKLAGTTADNGSSALFVLGADPRPLGDLDLRLMGLLLEKNGEVVQTGAGGAVLGHPVTSVVWLVNALAALGTGVHAGDVILSGSLTAPVDAAAGDRFTATFDRLGSVSVRFE